MDLDQLNRRAAVYAALADVHRLAIVDELALSDRAPSELAAMLNIDSNLLAHHLSTLESAGLIERVASQADRRRRYVRLVLSGRELVGAVTRVPAQRIVFVCTENAARSQLAQAIWNQAHPIAAISAGTRPAARLHPGTLRAAARRGINLKEAEPSPLPDLGTGDLVITVCDRAHEHLRARVDVHQLHWSVPDPATSRRADAYDRAADKLAARIDGLAPHVESMTAPPGTRLRGKTPDRLSVSPEQLMRRRDDVAAATGSSWAQQTPSSCQRHRKPDAGERASRATPTPAARRNVPAA